MSSRAGRIQESELCAFCEYCNLGCTEIFYAEKQKQREPSRLEMSQVIFHAYDVTNSASEKTNNMILQINKIMRDGIGLGGIFHGAIEVYDEEWAFGYSEIGTGVFKCHPKENPMYTYRESIALGHTTLSPSKVNELLAELKTEWPGDSYDLLSKNCNHFCDAFCEKLGVQKLPAWVNRFANAGDAAMVVAESTALRMSQLRTGVVSASRGVYQFLFGSASTSSVSLDPGTI